MGARRRQQGWWITVAQGGNIRRADTPVRLTRRMAHHFLNRRNYVQFQVWQPCGIRPFELEDETELGRVRWPVR